MLRVQVSGPGRADFTVDMPYFGQVGQESDMSDNVGQVGQRRTEVGHSLLRSYTVVQPVSTWMQHITTQRAPLPLFLSLFSFFLFPFSFLAPCII